MLKIHTLRFPSVRRARFLALPLLAATALALALGTAPAASASAATPDVGMGTAAPYSVLGGQAVTNTGPSTLSGDLGVSPGTALTGFPPGIVGGSTHSADAVAGLAQADVGIAYNDAAGRASTQAVAGDLVGRTLHDGVYTSSGPLALSGTLTFDGQGDPSSVFIVQIASTLITATASHVNAVNGAQACHIYWQVGSSATLGTASTFQGTILASTSVSVTTSAHVKGRALARTGSVTLDNDVFTSPDCANTAPPTSAVSTTVAVHVPSSATTASPVTVSATVSSGGTALTGTVGFYNNGVLIATVPVSATGHATLTLHAGKTLRTGTLVAVYNGGPSAAPSSSAPVRFTVTPVLAAASPSRSTPAPAASATLTTPVATATPTSGVTLAATGPGSALPLTGLGGGALLLGLLLVFAGRHRYVGRRRL